MAGELAGHGHHISPGTLYPTLHRLEDEGLLTSRQEVIDGRVRRFYRITDAGETELAEGRRAVAALAEEVLGWSDRQPARRTRRSRRNSA